MLEKGPIAPMWHHCNVSINGIGIVPQSCVIYQQAWPHVFPASLHAKFRLLLFLGWVGVVLGFHFLRWWPPSTMWASTTIGGCLNNPIFFEFGPCWRKTLPENYCPYLALQNFPLRGCFPYIIFCRYLSSLLSSGRFVIAACGSISVRELAKW